MSKALSNLLTVFKVARIVAKVVFILCIIGCVGSGIGLVVLPFAGTVQAWFESEGKDILLSDYFDCIVSMLSCAGSAACAYIAERYFSNVLSAETPFTFDGSKECFKLGITSIVISCATAVAVGIVALVFAFFEEADLLDVKVDFSITLGLFFLFLSMIFKYGAELKVSSENKTGGSDSEAH